MTGSIPRSLVWLALWGCSTSATPDEAIPAGCVARAEGCLCDDLPDGVPPTWSDVANTWPTPTAQGVCSGTYDTCTIVGVDWRVYGYADATAYYRPTDGALAAVWVDEDRCPGLDGWWYGAPLGACDAEATERVGECPVACDDAPGLVAFAGCGLTEPSPPRTGALVALEVLADLSGDGIEEVAWSLDVDGDGVPDQARITLGDGQGEVQLDVGPGAGTGFGTIRRPDDPITRTLAVGIAATPGEPGGVALLRGPFAAGTRGFRERDEVRTSGMGAAGGVSLLTFEAPGGPWVAEIDPVLSAITLYSLTAGDPEANLLDPTGALTRRASLAAGDVTGDGIADLVVARPDAEDSQVVVVEGPFDGVTDLAAVPLRFTGRRGVATDVAISRDLTGDGQPDLVLGGSETWGEAWILPGPITPDAAPIVLQAPTSPMRVAVADLDGDARDDLVLSTPAGVAPDAMSCWSRDPAAERPDWLGALAVFPGPVTATSLSEAPRLLGRTSLTSGFATLLAASPAGHAVVVGSVDGETSRIDTLAPCPR
jgi:hypothetical protein